MLLRVYSILFLALLTTPTWSAIEPTQSCPTSGETLQLGAEVAQTEDQARELSQRLSTLILNSIKSNPSLEPVVRLFAENTDKLADWMGAHKKPISLAGSVTRACGGGVVTYLGLNLIGSTDILTNVVISIFPAVVSYFWMKRNKLLQSIFAFTPAKKTMNWLKARFTKNKAPVSDENIAVNLLDRLYEMLASMGVELTFEVPKQTAAHLMMKSGQFKGNLMPIVGLLTLGQGLTEISLAHRTKEALVKARSEQQADGLQLMSDMVVLGVSTLSVFATALEYVSPGAGNWILIPLAVTGVSFWLDTFISPYLTKLFSTSKCAQPLVEASVAEAASSVD